MKTSIETVTTEKTLKLKLEIDLTTCDQEELEELYYVFKKHQLETETEKINNYYKETYGVDLP
jgi:predicted nucleotidyltransferase